MTEPGSDGQVDPFIAFIDQWGKDRDATWNGLTDDGKRWMFDRMWDCYGAEVERADTAEKLVEWYRVNCRRNHIDRKTGRAGGSARL